MTGTIPSFAQARWIWSADRHDPGIEASRDRWVQLRRTIAIDSSRPSSGRLIIRVAGDTRYRLTVNDRWVGDGPARSWPDELFYDEYDITDTVAGRTEVTVSLLVRYIFPGTGASIPGTPGCAVEVVSLAAGEEHIVLVSDSSWEASVHPGYGESTTKAANSLAHGEVYRADRAAHPALWKWLPAADTGPAIGDEPRNSRRIIPRDIPDLSDRWLNSPSLIRCRHVQSNGVFRSVDMRPLIFPGEGDVNKHKRFSGVLEVEIAAPSGGDGAIGLTVDPHDTRPVTLILDDQRWTHVNGTAYPVHLGSGTSLLQIPISGEFHDPVFHLQFVLPARSTLGPFRFWGPYRRTTHLQVSEPIPPVEEDTLSEEELIETVRLRRRAGEIAQEVPAVLVSPHHVAWERLSATGAVAGCPTDTLPAEASWAAGGGHEMVWDFGRETSGYLLLDIEAREGTVVDLFCFESMHDGRIEHTYSLNNTLRYVAADGRQSYHAFMRRGFRYCMVVFHEGPDTPDRHARLLGLSVRENLYPHGEPATLESSDERLNAIWEISRRTVGLCMEDTYVDCPAYEQTYWTGDARNTALYSYYLFGARPLFLHGARLAARSLDRSPLIESMAPSAWQNVIPSWSFLHVIAGAEYLFYSGDVDGFRSIYQSLLTNMANAAARRIPTADGSRLFGMFAWNMVDWAPMEVPDSAIVAHQNAQFVWACRKLADAAEQTGNIADAKRLTAWADETVAAINRTFWDDHERAYRDAVYRDGTRGTRFSVQTQLFCYLAGVCPGDREERVLGMIHSPPPRMVRIGSPFVHHFYLDLLDRTSRHGKLMDEIRTIWGNMLDHDATTCWEGWTFIEGDYTRSHCHAWSSAPAYFLPTLLLGIRPKESGFRRVEIRPLPVDTTWARGFHADTPPPPPPPPPGRADRQLGDNWRPDEHRRNPSRRYGGGSNHSSGIYGRIRRRSCRGVPSNHPAQFTQAGS